MKKSLTLLAMIIAATTLSWGQKYAFVDTEYILNNIPSYKAAQDKLDNLSKQWQKEIQDKYAEIDRLYKAYQNEAVLLTPEMKKKREEEIINKEKAVRALQQKYFGPEGDLFKKREELVKPIQDEVYAAVKQLAVDGNYAVIFDIASGPMFLYTNPRYDLSDQVLRKMGYKE